MPFIKGVHRVFARHITCNFGEMGKSWEKRYGREQNGEIVDLPLTSRPPRYRSHPLRRILSPSTPKNSSKFLLPISGRTSCSEKKRDLGWMRNMLVNFVFSFQNKTLLFLGLNHPFLLLLNIDIQSNGFVLFRLNWIFIGKVHQPLVVYKFTQSKLFNVMMSATQNWLSDKIQSIDFWLHHLTNISMNILLPLLSISSSTFCPLFM